METIIKTLLLFSVSAIVLFAHSRDAEQSKLPNGHVNNTEPSLVRARLSADTLEEHFKASLIKQYGTFSHSYRGVFELASGEPTAIVASSTSFSATNLQEAGVDESDRLKTDGEYIYTSSVSTPSIKIFRAEQGSAKLTSELPITTLNENTSLSGLYLRANEKQLAAISSDGGSSGLDQWFSADVWDERKTELFTIDISAPTEPKLLNKLSLDGQLINSRRIGSVLYLATRHTAKIPYLIEYPENPIHTAFNQILISKTSMSDLMPNYQIGSERQALFNADDCWYTGNKAADYSQHSIISLLAIDLDDLASKPKGQCFIGDAETLYASATAIYLATTQSQYTDGVDGIIYEGSPTTDIHKFSLDGTQTRYVGSASIEGHLGWQQSQKPFRMSENQGVLRVLSYVGEQPDSFESPARLHMLQADEGSRTLDVLATLPNESRTQPLGKKGEHIYASRFIGDRGYLVTFRNTDPLYVLDLSNPSDPHILSALEIEGFSDYLHPVGENFLLGIGKDAIAETADGMEALDASLRAWQQGVKLSLIDISNPSAPFEKEKIILGKRGTETAVSTTHHALTTLLRGNFLQVNFPVSMYEAEIEQFGIEPGVEPSHPADYFGWTQDALYRLNIDINSGEMSMLDPIVAKLNDAPADSRFYFNTAWRYDRSAIIGNHDYYLKRDEIFTASE